jgi:signal transduction histidine kinase/ActR/RegA family two-component response regulator
MPEVQVRSGTADQEPPHLLTKEHTILERPLMAFRPFGTDEQGHKIADVSGTLVLSSIQHLEKCVQKTGGPEAARSAIDHLCRLLNDRMPDSAYHVTPGFLRKEWNSYSYEFLSYLREICKQLSGDPDFHFNTGLTKVISPVFRVLARPFSLSQFSRLALYWAQRYTQGTVECEVAEVTDHSMIYRLRFTDHTLRQFGPYLKACAHQVCASTKGRMVAAPTLVHGGPPATVTDRTCIVNGDPWCEWEVRWHPEPAQSYWFLWALVPALLAWFYLYRYYPAVSAMEALVLVLMPTLITALVTELRQRSLARRRESLIQEQMQFVDARYEDLRDAFVEQEQTRVELRRKVNQLTALNRAGLGFSSTLDREALVRTVLDTLIQDLHYDRAMISFYDADRKLLHSGRIVGVSEEIAELVGRRELSVSDLPGFPASALRDGKPLLIPDIATIWDQLHPANQQLALLTGTKSLIWVPLITKGRILGTLTVDRTAQHTLTGEDLDLMVTIGNQISIALDNAAAYAQIEDMNIGLESKVRERTAELERADRSRSLFLSHVSHELRTPLTSVKGFVENLLDGLTGPLNEKQQRYLGRIVDNVGRLIRMINDLLDRTRIETGQLAVSPAEVDIERCVAEVVEQLRSLAVEKQQTLTTEYPTSTLIVWADRDRLIQIVTNLVHNAIKFTPQGGSISVHVTMQQPTHATIRVCDTGPGIPPEFLDKIFDPFFRVAQDQRGGSKGLGLGLSIVKTLIELHNGQIEVRSQPGVGTEFSVRLPVIPASSPAPFTALTLETRLLIVDDDPDIRQLLVDRLSAEGYEVETAVDGTQALQAIQQDRFSGVLLDIGIPGIDGLDVLRHVRESNRQLPIVIITAAESKDLAVRAISLGAQAYVLKPFDPKELEQVVDRWFAQAIDQSRSKASGSAASYK